MRYGGEQQTLRMGRRRLLTGCSTSRSASSRLLPTATLEGPRATSREVAGGMRPTSAPHKAAPAPLCLHSLLHGSPEPSKLFTNPIDLFFLLKQARSPAYKLFSYLFLGRSEPYCIYQQGYTFKSLKSEQMVLSNASLNITLKRFANIQLLL